MAETILIGDYDPQWPYLFLREAERIREVLGDLLVDIQHIGSTSVPGLAAKPRIDIMPGVASEEDLNETIEPMMSLGFDYISKWEGEMPYRRLYSRESSGSQIAVNIHTVAVGSEFWERHLLFRDYLRGNPGVAGEYARLKRELAPQFSVSSDYALAKTEFIRAVEARARAEQAAHSG